ncbi:hypothetical protein ACJX0J_033191, partial [Zea mays]
FYLNLSAVYTIFLVISVLVIRYIIEWIYATWAFPPCSIHYEMVCICNSGADLFIAIHWDIIYAPQGQRINNIPIQIYFHDEYDVIYHLKFDWINGIVFFFLPGDEDEDDDDDDIPSELKKGPDGRYINVFDVNIVSGPEYCYSRWMGLILHFLSFSWILGGLLIITAPDLPLIFVSARPYFKFVRQRVQIYIQLVRQ